METHVTRRDDTNDERMPAVSLSHGVPPLVEMFPDADIPVLEISMPTLDPAELFEIGKSLCPLRDEGILILGSGFSTHSLRAVDMAAPAAAPPPTWSSEFDDWLDRTLTAGDLDALMDFQVKAPAADLAHPRTEHFAPLFVALGAVADDSLHVETAIEGFWHGLSKRSVQMT
jgi:4,5-DOPA dioxygenase extradiol